MEKSQSKFSYEDLGYERDVDGELMEPKPVEEQTVCSLCRHTLVGNPHGLDQNDILQDDNGDFVHCGLCTYCKFCGMS